MVRRSVDNSELKRWRSLDVVPLLPILMDYAKEDPSFLPKSCHGTTRWHVSAAGTEFELLCTGPKFFDTRGGVGGAGAIDLICHCLRLPFKQVVRLLRERGL